MSAEAFSGIESRFLTPSPTARLTSRPSGVVKTMVRVSVSIDSTQPLTETLLANDTPARGTAWTGPWAAAGRLPPKASVAARMEMPAAQLIERIVIGSYPRETATRRTIPIPPARATTKASGEMLQHGPGDRLGLVEIGEMAGAGDGLDLASCR